MSMYHVDLTDLVCALTEIDTTAEKQHRMSSFQPDSQEQTTQSECNPSPWPPAGADQRRA
jgi:hypothetical protein